jgi:predicted Kef-type K+ transport protein
LSIIVLCNPAAALLIVLAFRHPLATALTIAASLAQKLCRLRRSPEIKSN